MKLQYVRDLGLRALVVVTVALAVALPALVATATIIKSLSLEQMCDQSDSIVVGVVRAQHTNMSADGKFVRTVSELEVTESWKGKRAAADVIAMRQLGGTYGDVSQQIAGNAKLSVGEEVVVFLRSDASEPGLLFLVGMSQGKYAVDRSGPEARVVRNLDGLAFIKKPTPVNAAAVAPSASLLSELRAQVRSLVE